MWSFKNFMNFSIYIWPFFLTELAPEFSHPTTPESFVRVFPPNKALIRRESCSTRSKTPHITPARFRNSFSSPRNSHLKKITPKNFRKMLFSGWFSRASFSRLRANWKFAFPPRCLGRAQDDCDVIVWRKTSVLARKLVYFSWVSEKMHTNSRRSRYASVYPRPVDGIGFL